jgi:[acyl-carrier-protein] S-malonyltransferase
VGGMLALIFKPKTTDSAKIAEKICEVSREKEKKAVWVANKNSFEQFVLAGSRKALDQIAAHSCELYPELRQALILDVSAPFHCPLMNSAAEKLKSQLQDLPLKKVNHIYISNVDARQHSLNNDKDLNEARELLLKQIVSPVLWVDCVQESLRKNCLSLLEVGPKKVLTSLCKRISWENLNFQTLVNIDKKEDADHVAKLFSA